MDNPSASLVTELNLESVKNGKTIHEVDTTAKNYYSVKTAEDVSSVLFVYNCSLDDTLESIKKNLKEYDIYSLSFVNSITAQEQSQIASIVYKSDEITKDKLNVSFDLKKASSWNIKVKAGDVLEKYLEGQRNNYLSILYLPIYVQHVEKSQSVLEVYAFVPIYYDFTIIESGNINKEELKGFPTPALTFNENNLLPSNA